MNTKVFLPFCVLPFLPLFFVCLDTVFYILPSSFLAAYLFLLNFPCIIENIHTQPLYYQDLYHEEEPHQLYQVYFLRITQVTMSVSVSSVVYYYYDQLHLTQLSKLEILGVFGGYFSLLLKIERVIGNSILSLVSRYKKAKQISGASGYPSEN
jgi:hypothetical protein